jgi:hypothetical protein
VALNPTEMDAALDAYYGLLGWTADGIPTHAALADAGVEWAADMLPAA